MNSSFTLETLLKHATLYFSPEKSWIIFALHSKLTCLSIVIHFKISLSLIHTSIVECMCYFMSNHHADPAIVKISESEK